jgi:hypothetical protein
MNKGKPTFKWDLENGEGSIGNIDAFRQLDPMLRCDILNDWIYDLNKEHEQASQDLDAYLREIRAEARAAALAK